MSIIGVLEWKNHRSTPPYFSHDLSPCTQLHIPTVSRGGMVWCEPFCDMFLNPLSFREKFIWAGVLCREVSLIQMSFIETVLAVGPEDLYSHQWQSGRWYHHPCVDFELLNKIATTVSIVNYILKHPEMVEYVRTYVRTYTCLSLLYAHLYYGPMTLASSTVFSYLPTLSSIPPGEGGQCTVCGQSRGHRVQLCWQWYCLYHGCRPDCQRPRLALSGFLEEVPHFWGLWAPVEWDPMERYHTIDSSCVTFPYPSFSSYSPTPTPIPISIILSE